jgi:indole-3-glycerol phosphate synthase
MILDDILAHTRETVAAARRAVAPSNLRDLPRWHEPRRGFRGALASAPAPAVVAEIKRASPSRGLIRQDAFDPAAHARSYAGAGATAISVLTERRWFGGALEHLGAVRDAVRLPLLRKDFLLDPYQVEEARAWGADAVLVIVAAVDEALATELLAAARAHGLDALVEVHDRRELDAALALGATLVGVNNRDLRTFETRLETTEQLAPLVPAGVLVVAESGIHRPADVRRMSLAGAHAVLVGEAFMAASDPGAALQELLAWR